METEKIKDICSRCGTTAEILIEIEDTIKGLKIFKLIPFCWKCIKTKGIVNYNQIKYYNI